MKQQLLPLCSRMGYICCPGSVLWWACDLHLWSRWALGWAIRLHILWYVSRRIGLQRRLPEFFTGFWVIQIKNDQLGFFKKNSLTRIFFILWITFVSKLYFGKFVFVFEMIWIYFWPNTFFFKYEPWKHQETKWKKKKKGKKEINVAG